MPVTTATLERSFSCNCEGSRRTCALLYYLYTSREVLWARASTSVQAQEYRHRQLQGGLGVVRQASALHFRMPR